jgi:hypothetical protein
VGWRFCSGTSVLAVEKELAANFNRYSYLSLRNSESYEQSPSALSRSAQPSPSLDSSSASSGRSRVRHRLARPSSPVVSRPRHAQSTYSTQGPRTPTSACSVTIAAVNTPGSNAGTAAANIPAGGAAATATCNPGAAGAFGGSGSRFLHLE